MPKATTIKQYLAALPADRKQAVEAVLDVIRKNGDKSLAEGMQYGMPAFFIPHSVYPSGYHCDAKQPVPFASVASQKNHIGLYLFCAYINEDEKQRFIDDWKKTGKRLDMGASCVRVKKLEDIPLDVLGKMIKRASVKKFLATYEAAIGGTSAGRKAAKKKASKKPAAKKKAAKKPAGKKKAAKKAATRTTKKKTAAKRATTKKKTTRKAAGTAKKATKKATKKKAAKKGVRRAAAKKTTTRKAAKKPAVRKTAKKAARRSTKKR